MTLTSISSKTYSYRIYEEIAEGHEVRLTNCIAINDNDATDKRDKETGLPKPTEHGKYGQYGRFEVDETMDRINVVNCEFQKADPTQFVDVANHKELIAPRGDDGQIPETSFAHLVDGSFLIDAGVPVEATTYRGIEVAGIDFYGEAPDLGAYESGETTSVSLPCVEKNSRSLRTRFTQGGLLLVTAQVPTDVRNLRLTVHDANGRRLCVRSMMGNTTAVRLPETTGFVIVSVEGLGFHASAKCVVK